MRLFRYDIWENSQTQMYSFRYFSTMKLKPTLKYKVEQDKNRHKRIQKQYGIDDKKVVVVEQSNMVKFCIRLVIRLFRITIGIVIFLLSAIGLIALLYPTTRNVLIEEWISVFHQILEFLNG